MTKTLVFLPILLGAGALPLSSHALETIDPYLRDELSQLAAPSWRVETGTAAFSQPYRHVSTPGAPGTGAPAPRSDVLVTTGIPVTLDRTRLAPEHETRGGHHRAAQLLAALAAAGLVARRRLIGR